MGTHYRSLWAPVLLTITLAGILVLGVHDIGQRKHAACADALLAVDVSRQGSDAATGGQGAVALSRFDRAEVWGCGSPETVRHAGIAP
jgi:hypothetical protein